MLDENECVRVLDENSLKSKSSKTNPPDELLTWDKVFRDFKKYFDKVHLRLFGTWTSLARLKTRLHEYKDTTNRFCFPGDREKKTNSRSIHSFTNNSKESQLS